MLVWDVPSCSITHRREFNPSAVLQNVSQHSNLTHQTPPVPQMNLNWKPILKNILEDPEGFIADGGWEFLDAEGGSASEGEEGVTVRGYGWACTGLVIIRQVCLALVLGGQTMLQISSWG